MQYIFIPSPKGQQVKDGVRGTLKEYADTVKIHSPHPVTSTPPEGVTDYTEPPQ